MTHVHDLGLLVLLFHNPELSVLHSTNKGDSIHTQMKITQENTHTQTSEYLKSFFLMKSVTVLNEGSQ